MSHFATSSPVEGCVVITFPTNALGGEQGTELSAIIGEELQRGTKTVVLDLSEVEVMNSTGLGMLVSSLASTGRSQARLLLAAVPQRVQNLLEMTHLVKVLDTVESVNQALALPS